MLLLINKNSKIIQKQYFIIFFSLALPTILHIAFLFIRLKLFNQVPHTLIHGLVYKAHLLCKLLVVRVILASYSLLVNLLYLQLGRLL